MIGIYKITSPSGKIYIGQSVNILSRISKYRNAKCITQPIILKSILKYGWENHLFEIVCECDKSELNERERFYQEKFDCIGRKGLNCMLTNTNTKSGKARQETIDKLTGRKLSESTRQKMRDKKLSEEHKLKISNSNIGHIVSKETRNKISESNKGKKRTQEYINKMKLRVKSKEEIQRLKIMNISKRKKVLDTSTGIIYNSMLELSRIMNINKGNLSCKLNNKSKNNTTYVYL